MSWLVGEGGSTKIDWAGPDFPCFQTPGINIEVQGARGATKVLQELPISYKQVERVIFYGPALHTSQARQRMHRVLKEVFTWATHIEVYHDLLGALRATMTAERRIVCILGTGSNCALAEGEVICKQAGGHGYLLGDEGSGAYLGKVLLSAWLHEEVPQDLVEPLQVWAQKDALSWRHAVYHSPQPNALLARWSFFYAAHQAHPWIERQLEAAFELFAQRTFLRWEERLPIYFIGSIGGVFRLWIERLCHKWNFENPVFIPRPISNLVRYHVGNMH
ncbi:MAG: hypothetical protein ACUVRD_00420 [Bacteroidia bacterium]